MGAQGHTTEANCQANCGGSAVDVDSPITSRQGHSRHLGWALLRCMPLLSA
jgi:hypothetical protein